MPVCGRGFSLIRFVIYGNETIQLKGTLKWLLNVTGFVKLQIPAGGANPAPPVGPALGAQGVNIMQFCQAFNAATQDQAGTNHPC